jgi:hypothetical protein
MSKCIPINHPNLIPSWGCHECKTMNGNNREQCKNCGHTCCYLPDNGTKKVPTQVDGGIAILTVPVNPEKSKLN